MFVDDTVILHINMHKDEYVVEAHKIMQTIISNLGQLKFATGGVFKPVKWFYHLIYFEWNKYNPWQYASNE